MSTGSSTEARSSHARLASLVAGLALSSCGFDRGDRWLGDLDGGGAGASTDTCIVGERRCGLELLRCVRRGPRSAWEVAERCTGAGLVCDPSSLTCTACVPGSTRCEGQAVERCRSDGAAYERVEACDTTSGSACRQGACVDLCALAREERSNVGCEYWAVDLDNARIDEALNAAAQQFAVVVSNPHEEVIAELRVEQDDGLPGQAPQLRTVMTQRVPPLGLRVLRLGPREVDGSAPGTFNTGTHSALTRASYRVTSSVPVVAYQFNPLDNVGVFSNDASLLVPVEALPANTSTLARAYVVAGWPQTIASTDDPNTNFSATFPIDLRAFITIVGTRPDTRVRVTPTARVLGAPGIAATDRHEVLDLRLGPFDVANLESDDFGADFSGTLIDADGPVVVFSGTEASDAPSFTSLAERQCCADHLEEQLTPVRTAGRRFMLVPSANRSRAVAAAGATIGTVEQLDSFRIIAATDRGAVITTSRAIDPEIRLDAAGASVTGRFSSAFALESTEPIIVAKVAHSQEAAGVPRGLPGGDPSLLLVPPIEQFRQRYVFLTPDGYAFDFVTVVAPARATVTLDDRSVDTNPGCTRLTPDRLDGSGGGSDAAELVVHLCQLSFPVIDTALGSAQPLRDGAQDDGVHIVVSDYPVGVLVEGFDRNVSYAYAAGTQLRDLEVR